MAGSLRGRSRRNKNKTEQDVKAPVEGLDIDNPTSDVEIYSKEVLNALISETASSANIFLSSSMLFFFAKPINLLYDIPFILEAIFILRIHNLLIDLFLTFLSLNKYFLKTCYRLL